jgi:hypothetical protein
MVGRLIRRIAAALSLFCACVALSVFSLPESASIRPWKGARLLAVPSSVEETLVVSALKGVGVQKVLSKSSQRLSFSVFDALQDISLDELDKRLVPNDPRRDFFIDSLHRFFAASAGDMRYALYYLFDESPSARLRNRISKALEPRLGWILVEGGNAADRTRGFMVWAAMCLAFFAFLPRKQIPSLALTPAFLCFFLSDSTKYMAACMPLIVLGLIAVQAYLQYPYEKKHMLKSLIQGMRRAIPVQARIALYALALPGFFILPPLPLCLCLIAACSCFVLIDAASKLRAHARLHRTFVPQPLRLHARGLETRLMALLLVFMGVELAALCLGGLGGKGGDSSGKVNNLLSFPYPHGYTGEAPRADLLPDFSDFKAHEDFQLSFIVHDLYGGQGSRVFREFGKKTDGSLEEVPGAPKLPQLKRIESALGIEKLLKSAGESAPIAYDAWRGEGRRDSPEPLLPIVFFLGAGLVFLGLKAGNSDARPKPERLKRRLPY